MMTSYYTKTFATLMLLPPVARASIRGSAEYPRLRGNLNIYQADEGLLVTTEVWGCLQNRENAKTTYLGFTFMSKEDAPAVPAILLPTRAAIIIQVIALTPLMLGICRRYLRLTAMRGGRFIQGALRLMRWKVCR